MKKLILFLSVITLFLTSCSNNYSNGERIGTVNKLSKKGLIWDTWEGHLNITQTGMTSTDSWDFSIDRDDEPEGLVSQLDSAAEYGWKVKLTYHEVAGWNWFGNRGATDFFITGMEVLDKDFTDPLHLKNEPSKTTGGRVIDTIYVVIVPKEKIKE
jgi:hypothetical protein